MSIAVSAVLVPSRRLRWALLCYGFANLGAAVALGAGLAHPFRLPWLGAGCCLLAAAAVLGSLAAGSNVHRIDISGVGQLRVTVQQGIGTNDARAFPAQLLPGSIVWPGLMLLRLRGEDGIARTLPLLPDSMETGRFRWLSVAIRDIASRT